MSNRTGTTTQGTGSGTGTTRQATSVGSTSTAVETLDRLAEQVETRAKGLTYPSLAGARFVVVEPSGRKTVWMHLVMREGDASRPSRAAITSVDDNTVTWCNEGSVLPEVSEREAGVRGKDGKVEHSYWLSKKGPGST